MKLISFPRAFYCQSLLLALLGLPLFLHWRGWEEGGPTLYVTVLKWNNEYDWALIVFPLLTPRTGWTWRCRCEWPWARGGPVADQWTQSWCADWSCSGSWACPCCQPMSYRPARAERWRAGRGPKPGWRLASRRTGQGLCHTVGCCRRWCRRSCPGSPCLRRGSPGLPASPTCHGGCPVMTGTCQIRACPGSWPCCWLWCQTIWGREGRR